MVLVGDHRQLGSVDAGGLFRLLATDAHAAELTAIRRFLDPWEAGDTRRLRSADTGVLSEYDSRGRISSGNRAAMLEAAHAAWAAARADGRTVVVMASDHDTVNQLALRARAARVAAGEVAAAGIRSGEQIVGVGDEVIATLNDRHLVTTAGGWVRNGDRWRIQAHRYDGTVVLDSLDGRGRVTVAADYATEHLALAYAVTVHKSQGLTVDDAVLVVDTNTAAEHLYVGMTRERHTNTPTSPASQQTPTTAAAGHPAPTTCSPAPYVGRPTSAPPPKLTGIDPTRRSSTSGPSKPRSKKRAGGSTPPPAPTAEPRSTSTVVAPPTNPTPLGRSPKPGPASPSSPHNATPPAEPSNMPHRSAGKPNSGDSSGDPTARCSPAPMTP